MIVYLTTSGEYSDYSVDHVFLKEEDANSYVQAKCDSRVEPYEVSEGPVERRVKYRLTWWPTLEDREGGHLQISNPNITDYVEDYDPAVKLRHQWHPSYGAASQREGTLAVEGWDKQDVLKVYSEQRAVHIAKREGIA